jgi:aspartyl-tRNA(Asn)/glutamyl-tRNA(Gln) amidotransferase subunit B
VDYEAVIGLEVHAELSTKSKIYCSCTTEFGGEENAHCCPVCTGMPGTLPVLNKNAVEYAVKAGLAMNCHISEFSKQDRKNYFYPDLPKSYQISQYDNPLCSNGYLDLEINGIIRRIGIERIHIEEDTGKLLHEESDESTFIDYNRSGMPLIEIVTKPDLRSAEETKKFLETLKTILQYIEVSDCKMQEGSLRVDVNISVRPKGQMLLGTRTEIKNLNSFKAVARAVESEVKRQIDEVSSGGSITRETRRWDDSKGMTIVMRDKEEINDYRYFPEPDLAPIVVDKEWIRRIKESLPELPNIKKRRLISVYGLPEWDAEMITGSKILSDFFEKAAVKSKNVRMVSNLITGTLMRILRERETEVDDIPFPAEYIARLVSLIDNGTISITIANKVLEEMFDSLKTPETIVQEKGLEVINNEDELALIVRKVLEENLKPVKDYKAGKKKALGFLVGQVMKETRGKANPGLINKLLREELEK